MYPSATVEAGRSGTIDATRHRKVLFVCSGNTCRSAMAQAIAMHIVASRYADSGIETKADSAGTMAGSGAPASHEGAVALEALGIPMHKHRSKPLTRALLDQADPIFALTRGHVAAILELDPTAADRVELLDPDGHDIPDPIGGPQLVYDATARKLLELITKRFEGMEW